MFERDVVKERHLHLIYRLNYSDFTPFFRNQIQMMLTFSLNNRGFLISFINLVLWSLKFAELLPVALLSSGWEEAELHLLNPERLKLQGVEKQLLKV